MCVCVLVCACVFVGGEGGEGHLLLLEKINPKPELREVKGCQKWVGPLVLLLKMPR